MNKSDAARVLPIANNEKYFSVKARTSIRLVGKLGVTLTWIAGSKLETCNKVCITQGPASRGTKNEFLIGEIIEVLNVGDLTAKILIIIIADSTTMHWTNRLVTILY